MIVERNIYTCAVMCIVLFLAGWTSRGWMEDSKRLTQFKEAVKVTEKIEEKVREDDIAQTIADKKRDENAKTITKEVIRYVKTSQKCDLSGDFKRLHDAAASNQAGESKR